MRRAKEAACVCESKKRLCVCVQAERLRVSARVKRLRVCVDAVVSREAVCVCVWMRSCVPSWPAGD